MPQLLKIGPYIIYFWSNENNPLEPVHVHVAEGKATGNATKLWITSTGNVIVANNNSKISKVILNKIARIIEANSSDIIEQWVDHFGEIEFYC